MDVAKLAEKARKSISRFCIEECKAYCCRKGHLVLNENDVFIVTNGRKEHLEKEGRLRVIVKDRYSLYIGNEDDPCPSLKNNKCIIHKSPKRPKTCIDFPIYIEGKNIKISGSCTAARSGMFYPYIKRFMMMGYTIIEGDNCLNSDFYEIIDNSQNIDDSKPKIDSKLKISNSQEATVTS